jgi:hypothetical protein
MATAAQKMAIAAPTMSQLRREIADILTTSARSGFPKSKPRLSANRQMHF